MLDTPEPEPTRRQRRFATPWGSPWPWRTTWDCKSLRSRRHTASWFKNQSNSGLTWKSSWEYEDMIWSYMIILGHMIREAWLMKKRRRPFYGWWASLPGPTHGRSSGNGHGNDHRTSEKYEFVNGKDDIPYIIYGKIKHVPNHQPDIYLVKKAQHTGLHRYLLSTTSRFCSYRLQRPCSPDCFQHPQGPNHYLQRSRTLQKMSWMRQTPKERPPEYI